jgi:ABC-2 type transport system permease protein
MAQFALIPWSASRSINGVTTAHATLAQASAQYAALRGRIHAKLSRDRLMTGTIAAFMIIYAVAAHLLVSRGLYFVQKLPLLGPLLTERMLHLMFFFFFIMLVLSNATISGMSLFRRRETGWLLSLPMPDASIVLWKTLEGLLLSSWGLILLSAPILAAFGAALGAGWKFYFFSMAAIVLLIAIAANLSMWLLLLVVRVYQPWFWKIAVLLIGGALGVLIWRLSSASSPHFVAADTAANMQQILQHTRLCTHPLLPSTWVAETAISSAHGLPRQAWFYLLMLLSYALAVWPLSILLGKWCFFPAWNRTLRQAEIARLNNGVSAFESSRPSLLRRVLTVLRVPRPIRALCAKDASTFLREPSQWGQCTLIFSLLLIYTSNLRNLGYNYNDPFWSTVISYLNLTVCSLAMSTLTTRFVFPQFSLEGRRFWIIGAAPLPLTRVLRQKLWFNLLAATPLTMLLVVVSSVSLKLPLHQSLYFIVSIALISTGLNALALSLGALLPNFRETNSAKIVSGFGGTLCLLLSFFYIIASITVLIVPAAAGRSNPQGLPPGKEQSMEVVALAGVALLSFIAGGIPYFLAKKQTKKLAYLDSL